MANPSPEVVRRMTALARLGSTKMLFTTCTTCGHRYAIGRGHPGSNACKVWQSVRTESDRMKQLGLAAMTRHAKKWRKILEDAGIEVVEAETKAWADTNSVSGEILVIHTEKQLHAPSWALTALKKTRGEPRAKRIKILKQLAAASPGKRIRAIAGFVPDVEEVDEKEET